MRKHTSVRSSLALQKLHSAMLADRYEALCDSYKEASLECKGRCGSSPMCSEECNGCENAEYLARILSEMDVIREELLK